MSYVNVHEAKTNLSRLLEAVESGAEAEVVIARNGKPVARLVPIAKRPKVRLGLAKGKFVVPDDFDADNETIAAMMNGRGGQ